MIAFVALLIVAYLLVSISVAAFFLPVLNLGMAATVSDQMGDPDSESLAAEYEQKFEELVEAQSYLSNCCLNVLTFISVPTIIVMLICLLVFHTYDRS